MLPRQDPLPLRLSGPVSRMVLMLLALALLSAPAFAVRRYTDPVYHQPKAKLKQGMSMGLDTQHQFRFPQGKNYSISHGGVAPQYYRSKFAYGTARIRHQ